MIKKHWWQIVLLILLLAIAGVAVFLFNIMHMSFHSIDADNPPKFIQAHVVDLDKVTMISKFRSGAGHDYSGASGETCRSMKHYFYNVASGEKLLPKDKLSDPVEGKDRVILSPVKGKIDRIERGDRKLNDEIVVVADSEPSIRIRLQHVTPLSNIKVGPISAGEPVGVAGQSFDVAMERIVFPTLKMQYVSYFAAMTDEMFKDYQAKGIKTRDELIVSREARNAAPLQCDANGQFNQHNLEEDFINLTGTPFYD